LTMLPCCIVLVGAYPSHSVHLIDAGREREKQQLAHAARLAQPLRSLYNLPPDVIYNLVVVSKGITDLLLPFFHLLVTDSPSKKTETRPRGPRRLFSRIRSRSLSELTRQITPPTKNGHADYNQHHDETAKSCKRMMIQFIRKSSIQRHHAYHAYALHNVLVMP
jgi:hypothetical protein